MTGLYAVISGWYKSKKETANVSKETLEMPSNVFSKGYIIKTNVKLRRGEKFSLPSDVLKEVIPEIGGAKLYYDNGVAFYFLPSFGSAAAVPVETGHMIIGSDSKEGIDRLAAAINNELNAKTEYYKHYKIAPTWRKWTYSPA